MRQCHRTIDLSTKSCAEAGASRITTWILLGIVTSACLPRPSSADEASLPNQTQTDAAKATQVQEESKTRQLKRKQSQERKAQRSRRASRDDRTVRNESAAPLRLQLRGKFDFDLGATGQLHGEGELTLELDAATLDRLCESFERALQDVTPILRDLSQSASQLPENLEKAERMLDQLSDPKTQANLQRAENLLRLVPGGDPEPRSQTD